MILTNYSMIFTNYIEIEWEKIILNPFKDWGDTKFYLNIIGDTLIFNEILKERLIINLNQKQDKNRKWIITPKGKKDKILFAGYVGNIFELSINILESDETSLINKVSNDIEKVSTLLEKNIVINKLFPLSLVFYGISTLSSLIKDNDDFLGTCSYFLERGSEIPIGKHIIGNFEKGKEIIGEIYFKIYFQPYNNIESRILFWRNVEIFPINRDQIGVFYSGKLLNSSKVYMLWTINNWKTSELTEMQKISNKYWVGIINIHPKEKLEKIEITFTNDKKEWDDKPGKNWIFSDFKWI